MLNWHKRGMIHTKGAISHENKGVSLLRLPLDTYPGTWLNSRDTNRALIWKRNGVIIKAHARQ